MASRRFEIYHRDGQVLKMDRKNGMQNGTHT
jgi:hypothetical protein